MMQWCLAANRHTGSLEQRRESKSAHWKSGTEEGKEGRRNCSPALSEDDEAIFSGARRTRHPSSRSRADRRRSRVGAARRRERISGGKKGARSRRRQAVAAAAMEGAAA